jgi:hypothetical protein
LNARLLRTYSRRCVAGLHLPLPLRIAARHLEPLLALNVEKEARKDALVIGAAHRSEIPALLLRAREIDREFVARLERLPLLSLDIRYGELEPIRRGRMERLRAAAETLLQAPWRGMRLAARVCYGPAEFEALLCEHLGLYAAEVQALGRAVRPAALLAPVHVRLRRSMEREARALAQDVTRLLYA